MDLNLSAPGITTTMDGNDVVIRIEREHAISLISILLHSKFSDGPRMEFLTNPYANALLEALMSANGTTEYMATRDGMAEALAPSVALAEDWTKRNKVSGGEADALLKSAIYPYSLT